MAITKAVEVAVPAAVGELSLLDRVDYQDAFRVETSLARTPEQWMRAFAEDAPRWFQLGWIYLLGKVLVRAQVGPITGPDHILGWKVLIDRPDAFAVGLDRADGPFARLIALTPPGQVIVTTQIRLGTACLQVLWQAVGPGHRFFAPYLLSRAASRSTMPASSTRTDRPIADARPPVRAPWMPSSGQEDPCHCLDQHLERQPTTLHLSQDRGRHL